MGYKEKKLQNGGVTAKAGIKIEELLSLEDAFPGGDIVERQRQVVAEAGEIFGIGRKRRLTASTHGGNVADASLLLMIDVPGFHPQTRAEEHNFAGIRGELRRFRVNSIRNRYCSGSRLR